MMVSNTRTGPVDPKMVSGCPEKKPQPIPHTKPDTKDSIAAMLFPVAWPKRPPNVIMGDRQAKYKKIQEATHCMARASLKSDQYLNNDYKTACKQLHNNYFEYVNEQINNDQNIFNLNFIVNRNSVAEPGTLSMILKNVKQCYILKHHKGVGRSFFP